MQALWFGVSIPVDVWDKRFEGRVMLQPEGLETTEIPFVLEVCGEPVTDCGDSEPWRHSRLRWLNSDIAVDNELVAPFTPLVVKGRSVECLGRRVVLDGCGLPEHIESLFSPALNNLLPAGREILAAPIRFTAEPSTAAGAVECTRIAFTEKRPGKVRWQSTWACCDLEFQLEAEMEFDGYIEYQVSVTAQRDTSVRDIRLEIPFEGDIAKYMMGMGHKGGRRPSSLDWKWNRELNQDTFWAGDVNAGLMVRLKGPKYEKPYMLVYYHYKPLNLPEAWHNGGRGGCDVRERADGSVAFAAFGGARVLRAGDRLDFWFDLAITPVKLPDWNEHWNDRYFHRVPESLSQVSSLGANVVNLHHGTRYNPYINWPFYETEALAAFVRACHGAGIRVKLYDTIKELTVRMPEFWALRSLGNEVIASAEHPGPSWQGSIPYADEWMEKNLEEGYLTAWRMKVTDGTYRDEMEASVVVSPMSRFNNYFLEGLRWLLEHTGIDGLYFDDVAFDRSIMKRIRKVLDRHKPGCRMDLHSWNYFSNNTVDDTRPAGWGNSMNLYIDNFAFLNRVWFGEGFDYAEGPDYWLVETSGIPFGIMGEMLQGGGNPWRGMLYGMSTRYFIGDPKAIWKLWDEFGIRDAVMLGYWNPDCPVRTGRDDVPATVYRKADKALVAIASWATEPVEVTLHCDFVALGYGPDAACFIAPAIPGLQEACRLDKDCHLTVEPGKGWLLIIAT